MKFWSLMEEIVGFPFLFFLFLNFETDLEGDKGY